MAGVAFRTMIMIRLVTVWSNFFFYILQLIFQKLIQVKFFLFFSIIQKCIIENCDSQKITWGFWKNVYPRLEKKKKKNTGCEKISIFGNTELECERYSVFFSLKIFARTLLSESQRKRFIFVFCTIKHYTYQTTTLFPSIGI